MIYFISDTHFGHDKEFIYKSRGYNNIKEHDVALIKAWNKIVKNEDEVYHLGDVFLGCDISYGLSCMEQLNGKIHIIRGNHDSDNKCREYLKCRNVVSIKTGSYYLKYNGYTFLLSHYPTLVSNKDDAFTNNKIYSLHGHTHSGDMKEFYSFRSINVAVDASQNRIPFSVTDICDFIQKNNKSAGKMLDNNN